MFYRRAVEWRSKRDKAESMAEFSVAYAPLKQFEGGWCDVSGDAGGETYAGIARNFFPGWEGWAIIDAAKKHSARREGAAAFSSHLAGLPGLQEMVAAWYRTQWWDRMQIAQFPQAVANELFEQAVNLGRGGAGRYLQRLCNAFNYDARSKRPLFADLEEDGAAGPKTLAALAVVLAGRVGETDLVHALNCLQGAHYLQLAAKSFPRRKFVDGWMKRTFGDPAAPGK